MEQSVKQRLDDIRSNPESHRHDFAGLMKCCMVDGCTDTSLLDAHNKYVALAGDRCDVTSGPCACGAWH